jgi:hypothetical protein
MVNGFLGLVIDCLRAVSALFQSCEVERLLGFSRQSNAFRVLFGIFVSGQ